MIYINDKGQDVFVYRGLGAEPVYIIAYRNHANSLGVHKVRGTTTYPSREAAKTALKGLAERKGWKKKGED